MLLTTPMTPTEGSADMASIDRVKIAGSMTAAPVTSSGFCTVPYAGMIAASASRVDGASSGRSAPRSSARSATMSQAPPEIDTMPMPGRSSRPSAAVAPAVISMSSIESTRITPRSAKTASMTRSSPTSAPVCATAVRADSALLPALSTTMALPAWAARRAARRNVSGSRTVSMNTAMARVPGSSTR